MSDSLRRQIGFRSAVAVIVASMVGQGIFTGPGFVGSSLQHPMIALGLWLVGGLIAMAGALCYAELGTLLPRAGGEYSFIHAAFGPLPAFLCGWGCFLGGFSAPIALCALTFSEHLAVYVPQLDPGSGARVDFVGGVSIPVGNLLAAGCIIAITGFHSVRVSSGVWLQDVLTLIKGAVILLLLGAALFSGKASTVGLVKTGIVPEGWSLWATCATNLIYVTLAYAGWNGATYIAGEVKDPSRVLPRATIAGTLIVTALYLALNVAYLLAVPVTSMEAKPNVALLAASAYFGDPGRRIASVVIAVTQFATISAFVLTGSRIYFAMAEDGLAPRRLARVVGDSRTPRSAVLLQGLVGVIMALSSSFRSLAEYAGVILSAFSTLALASLVVLRARFPRREGAYRAPFGLLLPAIYLIFTAWMISFFAWQKWQSREGLLQLLLGCGSLAAGLPVYAWFRSRKAHDRSGGSS